MEKKQLSLTLNTNAYSSVNFNASSFREPIFAFVTPAKAGNIEMLTDLTYCRESFCEYLRQDLRQISYNGIDLKKLHMLIHRRVAPKRTDAGMRIFQDQVVTGQRMVNAIEKHYGWPLTKVYATTPVQNIQNKNAKFYYITASKRWMKAPAMLSLFTLLFRIAANNQRFQFKDRIKSLKSLFRELDVVASKSSYSEMAYYRTHGKRWKLILDNYQKLFGGRNMASLYYPNNGASYYFSEGINNICDESSEDSELNATFCDIVKRYHEKTGKKI